MLGGDRSHHAPPQASFPGLRWTPDSRPPEDCDSLVALAVGPAEGSPRESRLPGRPSVRLFAPRPAQRGLLSWAAPPVLAKTFLKMNLLICIME